MRVHSSTRYAALALLLGALACAGNKPDDADVEPDQAGAARDTTTTDTLGGEVQNPPGYRGMERDTAIAPPTEPTPSDTFLQEQGQGQAQDTAGYSGMERVDTSAQAAPMDTTGAAAGAIDTTQAWGDTTGVGQPGLDTTGTPHPGDTTGYDPSQQPPQDTTSAP